MSGIEVKHVNKLFGTHEANRRAVGLLRGGASMVFDEALRLGNRIAILRDGRLIECGTRDDILHHPADDYVSRSLERRAGTTH